MSHLVRDHSLVLTTLLVSRQDAVGLFLVGLQLLLMWRCVLRRWSRRNLAIDVLKAVVVKDTADKGVVRELVFILLMAQLPLRL